MFDLFFTKLSTYVDIISDLYDNFILKIIDLSYKDFIELFIKISDIDVSDEIKYYNFYLFIFMIFTPVFNIMKLSIYNIYNVTK